MLGIEPRSSSMMAKSWCPLPQLGKSGASRIGGGPIEGMHKGQSHLVLVAFSCWDFVIFLAIFFILLRNPQTIIIFFQGLIINFCKSAIWVSSTFPLLVGNLPVMCFVIVKMYLVQFISRSIYLLNVVSSLTCSFSKKKSVHSHISLSSMTTRSIMNWKHAFKTLAPCSILTCTEV